MAYTTIYTSEEEKKKQQQEEQQSGIQTTGTPSTTQQEQTVTPQTAVQSNSKYAGYAYDPNTDQAYLDALAALQTAGQNKPTYGGTYEDQLQQLYDQIVGREKFRYNAAEDPLWQNYLEQYTTKGKLAMMDTMGQAAALTGGYGSSYGQQVGQQTYQGYLQEANQAIPEFYGMALDAYTREGDALNQQYAMLGDLREDEYARYMDSLNQYWNEVNYLQGLADTAYNRGYENWYNAYQMGVDADNTAYTRQQYAYDKLSELISIGYSPTDDELTAAGMTRAQADALKKYYAGLNSGGSGGGSGSKSKATDEDGGAPLTYDEYNKLAAEAANNGNNQALADTIIQAYEAGAMTESQAMSLLDQYEPKADAETQYKTTGGTKQKMTSTEATTTFIKGIKEQGWSKSKGESTLKQYVKDGVLTQAQADALKKRYIDGVVSKLYK